MESAPEIVKRAVRKITLNQRSRKMRDKKILLLSPPREDKHLMVNARCDFSSWSGCQWYPMILAHLGAFLQSKGCQNVRLIDAQAARYTIEQTQALIAEHDPDYTLVFTSRSSVEEDLTWVKYAEQRKLGSRACLYSPFIMPIKAAEIVKAFGVDFISFEPEKAFISWMEGKTGHIRGEKLTQEEYSEAFDNFWPTAFMLNNVDYRHYMAPSEPYPFIDLSTSRGCSWGKCTFCLWPKTYSSGYLKRHMNSVVSEVKCLESLGVFKGIMIEDDTFTDERAYEFAISKLEAKSLIPWSCLVRGDLSDTTLLAMKMSGCLNLHVGYESGCNSTLKAIRKGLTAEQMADFTRRAKKIGLRVHGDFQIGIDKTVSEINETINYACKIRPETVQFQIHIPFFGQGSGIDPEVLKDLAQYAYKKFYGNPKSWPAVIRQMGKPRVFMESVKNVLEG